MCNHFSLQSSTIATWIHNGDGMFSKRIDQNHQIRTIPHLVQYYNNIMTTVLNFTSNRSVIYKVHNRSAALLTWYTLHTCRRWKQSVSGGHRWSRQNVPAQNSPAGREKEVLWLHIQVSRSYSSGCIASSCWPAILKHAQRLISTVSRSVTRQTSTISVYVMFAVMYPKITEWGRGAGGWYPPTPLLPSPMVLKWESLWNASCCCLGYSKSYNHDYRAVA